MKSVFTVCGHCGCSRVAGRGLDADDLAAARSLLASTSLWTRLFFIFHRMTSLAVKTMRTQSKGRERKSGGLH